MEETKYILKNIENQYIFVIRRTIYDNNVTNDDGRWETTFDTKLLATSAEKKLHKWLKINNLYASEMTKKQLILRKIQIGF